MPYASPEAQREYQRVWMAKRRAEFFADKACGSCGSVAGLELDHVDPTKKVSHRIWSWSAARRNEEISKCQVLCQRCHLVKTVAFSSKPTVHGTTHAYNKRKCRCAECRAVHNARIRASRKRRPCPILNTAS